MYTIAIVDDEDWILEMLTKYLSEQESDFFVTGTYTSSATAYQAIRQQPVNILITDVRMFGYTGLDLARHVKEDSPSTEILMISAYKDFDYVKEAMQYGVYNYLLKPIDFDELSACLQKIKKSLNETSLSSLLSENTNLFIYYALSGIFPDSATIRFAAKSIHLPFNIERSVVTLLGAYPICTEPNNQQQIRDALDYQFREAFRAEWVYDMLREGSSYLFLIFTKEPFLNVPDNVHLLKQSGNLLEFLHLQEMRTYRRILRSKEALLSDNPVDELKNTSPPGMAAKQLAENAKRYMEQHYQSDLSRDDIADAIYVSGAHLSRTFKLAEGMGVMDYLMQIRMKKAMELLGNSTHLISDVCEQIGYRNYNTFLQHFRQYTSRSPTDYRRFAQQIEDFHHEE